MYIPLIRTRTVTLELPNHDATLELHRPDPAGDFYVTLRRLNEVPTTRNFKCVPSAAGAWVAENLKLNVSDEGIEIGDAIRRAARAF